MVEGQERHALQHLRARAVLQGAVGQVHLPRWAQAGGPHRGPAGEPRVCRAPSLPRWFKQGLAGGLTRGPLDRRRRRGPPAQDGHRTLLRILHIQGESGKRTKRLRYTFKVNQVNQINKHNPCLFRASSAWAGQGCVLSLDRRQFARRARQPYELPTML